MKPICCRRTFPQLLAAFAAIAAFAAVADFDRAQVARAQVARAQAAGQTEQVYEPGDLYLESSRVYVHVGKTGFGHEHGVTGMIKQGAVHLGATKDAGAVVFDMTSFAADTEAARKYVGLSGTTDESTQKQVTENMLGSAVLDVKKYPTATFKITSVTPAKQTSPRGLAQFRLTGDFTLHGKTKTIDIYADVEEKGPWQHLRGGFEIKQSDYGIKPFTKAFGAVGVADKLTIYGDLWLSKERQVIRKAAQR